MSRDLRLITFDLDNTLWDVHSVIRNAEADMRAWLDGKLPEFGRRFQGDGLARVRASVVDSNPRLAHDVSALRRAVLEQAFLELGLAAAEARRLAGAAFDVFYEARQRVVFFDGALRTLEQLAGEFRLGALTNGNADVERIGLKPYFSFAFSAADAGASKPAPELFHLALRHCRVGPGEAVHVGDHLVDDIQGAGSIGIHTIWTNHTGAEAPADAHPPTATVRRLGEVPTAITDIRTRTIRAPTP